MRSSHRRHADQHHCPDHAPACPAEGQPRDKGWRRKLRKYAWGNMTIIGILSLVWLLVRSGLRPTRLNYPCQKAALVNATVLLGGAAVPIAARLPGWITRDKVSRPWVSKLVKVTEVAGIVALAAAVAITVAGALTGKGRPMGQMKAAAASLALPQLRSSASVASNIYVAEGIPAASEHGVDTLIQVMGTNGLRFFKTGGTGAGAGPDGLIGKNDVVLIKVNGEWKYRGGTNTDVVKGLINAIVHHPDGFTGEVVIVENGQWASFMDNLPNNRNTDGCNAEDHTQSFNDVARMFAGNNRVSVYDWTQVQNNAVNDFDKGDMRDGYVYMPEIEEGYPKFTTIYGTRISLRNGVWNGSGYDAAREKFLNVPVLKDHSLAGVTCSIKHFMGVQDLWKMTQDAPHDPMINQGLFGKVMLKARYPDLNIADAIWVTPAGGPNGPYQSAVRVNRLLASQDPCALDYYAAKHVLMPISGDARHNPDTVGNALHTMLFSTRDVLLAGGKQVTTDESKMNVFSAVSPQQPPKTPFEYFLAEGCTDYGFETWVLVANPNDKETKVYITYLTDKGAINKEPVVVPALSRLTVNASADIWAMNSGIRVGSDLPVFVERAMYWNERVEGHDSIGTSTGATDWYLADGHTSDGFETWVEVLNPGSAPTTATLTYMTPAGTVPGPTVTVGANSRFTVRVNDVVTSGDVSTRVTSAAPVVVEHSLYWGGRRGGMCSNGVKVPSPDWYFAEGATHSGFETYVLVLNPGAAPAHVTLDLITPAGGKAARTGIVVPAGTRRTVKLNDIVPNADVSTHVHSDVPIVSERSMLWPVAGGRAGHETPGMTGPATEIFMPEGCTGYGFETWLLLQNPGMVDSTVSVDAMTSGGEKKMLTVKVAAGQRKSVRINDYYQGNLSIRLLGSNPVCAERSVYWNGRAGGTSSIGYPL